jgi:hypothetical protein
MTGYYTIGLHTCGTETPPGRITEHGTGRDRSGEDPAAQPAQWLLPSNPAGLRHISPGKG